MAVYPLKPNPMKIKLLLNTALAFMLAFSCFATPTVKEQLISLNKYWMLSKCNDPLLDAKIDLNTDVKLIRTHLTLVEQYLRETTPKDLDATQLANRLRSLDNLHRYCKRGVFPKNLYHKVRTPYFIDDFGTACAVGQLIIESGHADLANKISRENNYAYIEDMNYPELGVWAKENGFRVEELKWIQPSYGCNSGYCANDTQRNASCYGSYDGCIGTPSTTLLYPPYSYQWEWYDTTNQVWYGMFQSCDLAAGQYKCRITDSLGYTEDKFFTIDQPDPIELTKSVYGDGSICQASATVYVSGGMAPYTFYWQHTTSPAGSVTNLCTGIYSFLMMDNNLCSVQDSIVVDIASGIEPPKGENFFVVPNPVADKLYFIASDFSADAKLQIVNTTGQVVYSEEKLSPEGSISVSSLSEGIYFLTIKDKNQVFQYKFIRQEN